MGHTLRDIRERKVLVLSKGLVYLRTSGEKATKTHTFSKLRGETGRVVENKIKQAFTSKRIVRRILREAKIGVTMEFN
jgi:hypothetical protein